MYRYRFVCRLHGFPHIAQGETMKKSILLVGLLGFTLFLSAQSLLWKISGNGLQYPAYILGTHHIVEGTFLDSIPGCMEAFGRAEQLIKEVDEDSLFVLLDKREINRLISLPGEMTLKDLMTRSDYQMVKRFFKKQTHLNLWFFRKTKPIMILHYLQNKMYLKYMHSDRIIQGMDSYLQKEARKKERKIVGLDDVVGVIEAYVNAYTLADQAESLLAFIKQPVDFQEEREISRLHREFNPEKLQEYMVSEMSDELYNLLVNERNHLWMQKLPELINEKSSFIAVGVGHLLGDTGLISQFRNRGYIVEPVFQ